MIVISKTRNGQFKVSYLADNDEPLSHTENLKTKRNCFKNILAMAKITGKVMPDLLEFPIKDMTLPNPEVFMYAIDGVKKKAGIRKADKTQDIYNNIRS